MKVLDSTFMPNELSLNLLGKRKREEKETDKGKEDYVRSIILTYFHVNRKGK